MNQPTPIGDKEQRAIELKYLGKSYVEIAQNVGVEYQTVKSWFMRSGRLYRAFVEYSVEQTQERRERAKSLYMGNLEKAVRVLGELLDSKDERVRLAAAKGVIEKQNLDADPVSLDELHEIKIMDMMEAVKRIRQEKEANLLLANQT